MSEETYEALLAAHAFIVDGRVYLAREILEELLHITTDITA